MINISKVTIGTVFRDSSDTCGMPDAAYDRVNSEYGRNTINFPNEQFIKDYKEKLLKPDAYDDFFPQYRIYSSHIYMLCYYNNYSF